MNELGATGPSQSRRCTLMLRATLKSPFAVRCSRPTSGATAPSMICSRTLQNLCCCMMLSAFLEISHHVMPAAANVKRLGHLGEYFVHHEAVSMCASEVAANYSRH